MEIGKLTMLVRLRVTDCDQVTDAGLCELKELKSLAQIILNGCAQITDVGLKEILENDLTSLFLTSAEMNDGRKVGDRLASIGGKWLAGTGNFHLPFLTLAR